MKTDNEVSQIMATYLAESPEWFKEVYFNDTIVHETVMHCSINGFTTQQMQWELIKNLCKGLEMLRNDTMDYLVDADKHKCPPSVESKTG